MPKSLESRVLEALELPMSTPYSLTKDFAITTVLGIVLMLGFGPQPFLVGICTGLYIFHLHRWIHSRTQIKKLFVSVMQEATARFPNARFEEVLLGVYCAWVSQKCPFVLIKVPKPAQE